VERGPPQEDKEDEEDEEEQMRKRRTKEAMGRVREGLGWATGDRKVEAEGHLEHRKAAEEGDDIEVDEREVEAEERRVRRRHGDMS